MFLSTGSAQHRNLVIRETRPTGVQLRLQRGSDKYLGDVRVASVGVKREIKSGSRTAISKTETWEVLAVYDPQTKFYWWTYSLSEYLLPSEKSLFNFADALEKQGTYFSNTNGITCISTVGAALYFNVSNAKAESAEDALKKAVAQLDQLLPNVQMFAIFQLNKEV